MANENKQSMLIDVVDEDTRNSIIRLQQKLKGLQAEVQVKLDVLQQVGEEKNKEEKEQLQVFKDEIEQAIKGMETITRIAVAPGVTEEEFLQSNQKELQVFKKLVAENVDKISKLKNEL